jgi:HD-like signal output (HDOD) protein/prolyl-tRNA editing enzyme YbaK/EbsC (Cys-tRNA(Pro) deacylase)
VPLINSVEELLQREGVKYWAVPHELTGSLEQAAKSAGIPMSRVARAVVLNDDRGVVLAILPLTHLIDFGQLKQTLGRDLKPGSAKSANSSFYDREPRSVPPIAIGYNYEVIIEDSLRDFSTVYFEPGSHDILLRVHGDGFVQLQGSAARWMPFAQAQEQLVSEVSLDNTGEMVVPDGLDDVGTLAPLADVKDEVQQIYDLPVMPQMAQSLLKLQSNPDAEISELARVVELDPSLAAQVVRYARSPFFGFRGKIETIHDAITRVLGFDMVMHMALGIAAGQAFRNPPDGPLGLVQFWRHATYSAALSQALVPHIGADEPPKPGLAYLTGLLHNFGYLLLGHMFQPQFFVLNKLVESNPNIPVTTLEAQVLGASKLKERFDRGHADMGAWLMEAWSMPGEVVVAMREHHNPHYRDEHAVYANLTLATDHLLKRFHVGDADSSELPESIFQALQLDPTKAIQIAERVIDECQQLDAMARTLAA